MSLKELLDMMCAWLGHKDSPEMRSRCKMWLYQTHMAWVAESRVISESSVYPITIAAATTLVTDVPLDFQAALNWKIISKAGDTSVTGLITEKDADWLDRYVQNRDVATTGTPEFFAIRRTSHPKETGDGTTLNIVSTATAARGDNVQRVSLVGYPNTTRDRAIHQEFTLNGTTNVSVTTPIRTIISFSKDTDTVGFVQLKDGSGTVLAELMPWSRSADLVSLEVFPYVNAEYATELRYYRRPIPMVNESDTPAYVDPQFHMGLAYSALAEFGASFIDDDRVATIVQQAAAAKQKFMWSRRRSDTSRAGWKWGEGTGNSNPTRIRY